jgi:hypothetical protein
MPLSLSSHRLGDHRAHLIADLGSSTAIVFSYGFTPGRNR